MPLQKLTKEPLDVCLVAVYYLPTPANRPNLENGMNLKPRGIVREALDARSSGDQRKRVDAYFVEYPHPDGGPWIVRFEVPRGSVFVPQEYATQADAIAARGFMI